jgi:uncharacterized membrane protein
MARIIDSVRVKASVEEVFQFVADYQNLVGFYDGIEEVEPDCEVVWGDGARIKCTMKSPILGERTYILEVSDFVENHGWTYTAVEGGEMTEHWWFEALPGYPRETKVNYDLQYKVPVPVVGPLLDALVMKKDCEERAQNTLRNIKLMVEGHAETVMAQA